MFNPNQAPKIENEGKHSSWAKEANEARTLDELFLSYKRFREIIDSEDGTSDLESEIAWSKAREDPHLKPVDFDTLFSRRGVLEIYWKRADELVSNEITNFEQLKQFKEKYKGELMHFSNDLINKKYILCLILIKHLKLKMRESILLGQKKLMKLGL